MNKKILIPIVILVLILIGGIAFLVQKLQQEKQENDAIKELAEINKKEMENEYAQFANQYSEMKARINNDSIIAQLTAEQEKTQQLLAELKRVKSTDAVQIMRLKKELATVRAVLRSYVLQIDSLNRLNENLTRENTRVKEQYNEATKQIEGLSTEKQNLSEKIAIASQLNATGISMTALNKRNKSTEKMSKCTTIEVDFTLARNVTAETGHKDVYVRIMSPTGNVLQGNGSFNYANKTLAYTMKKTVEYGGEELPVKLYWNVNQALVGGSYQVSIFVDGNMIGGRTFSFR